MKVEVSREGALTIVAIDRPERRNAVDAETALALRAAFDEFERDDEAAVAILTGTGGAFCAGWDLKAFAEVDADGTINLLGRGSMCINTGGEKVFPEEVEAVLKGHEAVYDVLVVGAPDDRWGQRVVAVVQPTPGETADEDELRSFARARLAGYKVPKQVVLVDAVVRSPSGKADYRWAASVAAAT